MKKLKGIEENLSRITTFFVEENYRHLVVGPEGRNKLALEKAHKVNISFKEYGEVLIMGKERRSKEGHRILD